MPTREEFSAWIQDVLARLYDSSFLHQHELTNWISEEKDALYRSQEVRRRCLDAIRSLRPAPGAPAQSPDWRAYRILQLRYIEGLTPQEVMEQVGLSRSHYFREQARAVQTVTNILWEQCEEYRQRVASIDGQAVQLRESLAHMEVERLCANAIWQPVEVSELFSELQPMLLALAGLKQVALHLDAIPPFEVQHGDPIIFRQAILNLLSFALDVTGGVCVDVTYFAEDSRHGLQVLARIQEDKPGHVQAGTARQGIGLDVCSQLTAAMNGRLQTLTLDSGDWIGRLIWHKNQLPTLLLVDDNQNFHGLFQRYLANYNWQVVGARSGKEARQVLADTQPRVIVLDVMMPEEDGWKLLEWLQSRETTRHIPVIICSVLNEPQLAAMLGASAYLTKPVTQHALVHALARWS